LPNAATIYLSSTTFYEAQNLSFANITISVSSFTVKYPFISPVSPLPSLIRYKNFIQVIDWPFALLQNRLVFEYDIASDGCVSTNLQLDDNQNVIYFSCMLPPLLLSPSNISCADQSGDVSLFVNLIRPIILDGKVVNAQFRVVNNSNLQVIVPHFWNIVGRTSPSISLASPYLFCRGGSELLCAGG
jgi:hypothetical protein